MSIKPALTAEEWATSGEMVVDGYISWELGCVDVSDTYSHAPERFRHALAALALHGQPFGFRHEDVDLLRWAVTWAKVDAVKEDSPKRVADLAARIEALLPPRET